MKSGYKGVDMKPRSKQEQREYEKNIKGDVMDFMKEIAGVKRTEFPIGDAKEWRKGKETEKKRKYDDENS